MRVAWAILVGITVLGCKGQDAPKPAEQHSPAKAPSPAPSAPPVAASPESPPGAAAKSAPAMPRLDLQAEFDQETEDKAWAVDTESAIKAAAPDLTDVDCKQRSCRANLTAVTQDELMKKADALEGEDSLRGTQGAKSVLLTAPQTVNGKLTMKIYVRYDR